MILHRENDGGHTVALRQIIGMAAGLVMLLLAAGPALAQDNAAPAPAASAPDVTVRSGDFRAVLPPPPRAWMAVPRSSGRITARELGLVINSADPYSVDVGGFYARARGLAPAQVLRVALPAGASLTPEQFAQLKERIDGFFGPGIQALALAWRMPYAVSCNSITGALALGYDPGQCVQTCAPSRRSPYFDSGSARPFTDLHLRPSMLLAARDVAGAKKLIRRGISSDRSLGWRGAPPVHAYYVTTSDKARSVRAPLFPPAGRLPRLGIDVHLQETQALQDVDRVLLYMTGLVRVDHLDRVRFVPGALADHLTSYGGRLDELSGQMSVLSWIDAGATASYGTVSEPCSHPQKFPHPQALLLHYAQGESAIEAYWKSVAWPLQGVFVGEPLAAPFARR